MSPLLFLLLLFSLNVAFSGAREDPFTPKSYLSRYWTSKIITNSPKPTFFLSKASPLTAVDAARFAKLAADKSLSAKLPDFCSAANLFCFPDLSPSLAAYDADAKFSVYSGKDFTNYGSDAAGGLNSFKNYSNGDNMPLGSFRRYGRNGAGHDEKFTSYGLDGNSGDQSFTTYGTSGTGGTGDFNNYNDRINVPNLKFTSYSVSGNGKAQNFKSYSTDANSGSQSFRSYGKDGNGVPNEFTKYGDTSNAVESKFTGYGESANGESDTFTSYGFNGNVPENTFTNYLSGQVSNGGVETFKGYRDQSNVGDDFFKSYAKNSNAATVKFSNYGNSTNEGSDSFSGYGKGASSQTIGFKEYGLNTTFKDYEKKESISFSQYRDQKSAEMAKMDVSGSKVNKWVEPGKFFREEMLKEGTVMPMPDIRDKMPKRSFLPRVIWSKLPFATSQFSEMKQIFHASDNSTVENLFLEALADCERAPSKGETKRCVGSGEDMIDFSTSVLGRKVTVQTTENTNGSNNQIMIGSVKGINGGKVTQSVSCHQTLLPYLLYYCHSVPKVRVYEADILDPKSKAKINHGVAICHLDTSDWSPTHGAFVALGSEPGKIEVCHWIFENDMTWTIAD